MALLNRQLIKLNNRGVRSVTDFGGTTSLGTWALIKKITASSSATVSFVDGSSDVVLDNTYKEYVFTFNNIHPQTDNADFGFTLSIDSGSNYNVAKTSSYFNAYQNEAGTSTSLTYQTDYDLAQGTGAQFLLNDLGNDADQSGCGFLHLFDPSSTTYVKHFIFEGPIIVGGDFAAGNYMAGYGNTTSAVDAVQFSMNSGNIDAGDICLYGLS